MWVNYSISFYFTLLAISVFFFSRYSNSGLEDEDTCRRIPCHIRCKIRSTVECNKESSQKIIPSFVPYIHHSSASRRRCSLSCSFALSMVAPLNCNSNRKVIPSSCRQGLVVPSSHSCRGIPGDWLLTYTGALADLSLGNSALYRQNPNTCLETEAKKASCPNTKWLTLKR